MKKILLSLSLVVAIGAVVVGATTAFYNDEETSSGNVLAAGAIDLGVDNESYYNGVLQNGENGTADTSWELTYDLDDEEVPHLFFNFTDLKPGDWGEDTISLHVKNNDSWLCADVTLTKNDDVTCTEPEGDVDNCQDEEDNDIFDGDLAQNLKWYWWADDGDNVYEEGEELIHSGVSFPNSDQTYHVTLADSTMNIWSGLSNDPVEPGEEEANIRYIGKAWCFGDSEFEAYEEDDTTPVDRPVKCNGSQEGNETQTDALRMDVTFRAEQSRNNLDFSCQSQPSTTP